MSRGQFVFHRETAAMEIFVVERGRVRLERITEAGTPVTLGVAVTGEGFAEAALFSECYHCDAIAERRSSVLGFSKTSLLASLKADPERCLALLERAAARIRYLRAVLELRGIHSASDRLLQYLRVREWHPGPETPERPLKAIAEEVGLAPETLYRTIKELQREGSVGREGSRLWLVREAAGPQKS